MDKTLRHIKHFFLSLLPTSKKKALNLIQKLVLLFVWVFVIGVIIFLSLFIYLERRLPDPESIALRKIKESTKIYDRTGQILLYDIHGEEKRTVIPWEQIPESVKRATLAAEDSNFYSHRGFEIKGIVRAFFKNIGSLELAQGGSTITQQLIKKALVGDEKTFTRKIKELVLSVEIERRFSKDEIFWMYLNQIPYGSNAYGIEAASKTYFGKGASELTIAEAATLASLPKAPSYYSPYGNHVDELMGRKNFILSRMKDLSYITNDQFSAASQQKLEFKKSEEKFQAPHFVIMVKEYLERKYGRDAVENGGFRIITTLDANLQNLAEEAVAKYAKVNTERYKAKNSSLVAISPKTGEVLALVGSRNYFDSANDGNYNVATANRQPGSAFKPFAYAQALNKGYTDSTIIFDLKTEFSPLCSPDGNQLRDQYGQACYHPRNYDGRFRGPVTLRQALSQSLNIPSVKTLYLAGIQETVSLARKMGIVSVDPKNTYGLSLVLGGAEVRLIDLASAYGVFANDGVRNPWVIVERVESSGGAVLEQKEDQSERVLDEQIARQMNDILSDNAARAGVFGYSSSLYIPGRDVAAKTGTTQENRDGWVVGYTPNLVVGVWNGNNDNSPMTAAGAGVSASGPMWNYFISRALAVLPNESFRQADPVVVNKIMLDGNYSHVRDDGFTEYHSILYYVDKDNPQGPFPSNPEGDPQFRNWEWPIANIYTPPNQPSPSPSESPLPSF